MILLFLCIFCFNFYDKDFVRAYSESENGYIRGCYYTNWAQYRQERAKFLPENYSPGMCTHLFYAFAVMNSRFSVIPFEWNDESTAWSKGMYERVNDLKKLQPNLKTLLSFGGWIYSQANKQLFRSMMATAENRKAFIQSAIQMTVKHKFNGFDMDWEYPEAEDKENFANLLREMAATFRSQNLLLTAAVAGGIPRIQAGYDIPSIAKSLDFVNIMTYDMHGGWETVTGLNSPMYDRNEDGLSLTTVVHYWVSNGLPKEKVIIGFPTYGRSWTLSTSQTSVGSPGVQAPAGQYTREAGFLSFYEIKDILASGGQRYFDEVQKTPYLVQDKLWVGYDDEESFNIKLDWLKQNGFKGAFIWSMDLDDFSGSSSGGQKYPLMKTIVQSLVQNASSNISKLIEPVTDTINTTETATLAPVNFTYSANTTFACPGPGVHYDPKSCTNFYNCNTKGDAFRMKCADKLQFNPVANVCDWPWNVRCTVN